MINSSKKSVSLIIPASEIKEKTEAVREAIEKAKKRGIKIDIITSESPENKEVIESMSKLTNLSKRDINARIAISDNERGDQ